MIPAANLYSQLLRLTLKFQEIKQRLFVKIHRQLPVSLFKCLRQYVSRQYCRYCHFKSIWNLVRSEISRNARIVTRLAAVVLALAKFRPTIDATYVFHFKEMRNSILSQWFIVIIDVEDLGSHFSRSRNKRGFCAEIFSDYSIY